jgi:tetratricopeptide (TPR) repeat protein/tRNA A-37 threonylcarbamoyl transferase component Bud32
MWESREHTALENKDILEPGTVLFGYRVLQFIGEGVWSYVYKARHPQLPMLVAIKQLKPEWVEDQDVLQRFLREAEIVARLNHPNVVRIYDLRHDEETGLHYIITEFAEKGTLADRLEKSAAGLPVDEVLHLAMGICSGLEAVHRRGVVHRDVKPSNILLFDVGQGRDTPKLSDFGIAKAPAVAGAALPRSSGVYGSFQYMSPEQLDEEAEVDRRSDLYSLGILLYNLLTAQVPFTGEPGEVFWAHMYVAPTPPSELRPDIPEPLEQVVLQALRKSQEERYQSATDMHEALRAIVDISTTRERQRKFRALLERGLACLGEGDWEAAIEVLRQADVVEPGNERVLEGLDRARDQQRLERLYDLGLRRLEAEDWGEAHDCLTQVMACDPDYSGGRAGEALARVMQALEREFGRRTLLAWYRTGMGRFRKWQWARAIEELGRVVARDPAFEDAADRLAEAREYVRMGRLFEQAQRHRERGEWQRAVDLLEEVGLAGPPHIDVTEELEQVRKRWAEARKERELAAWYEEGVAHLKAGNPGQARKSFEAICKRRPDYRDAADRLSEADERWKLRQLFERASEHESARNWAGAIVAYREALEIDPHDRRATRCLARVQKRADREERRARRGLDSGPEAARPGRASLSAQVFRWMSNPAVALIAGGLCTFLIAQLAKEFLASLDPMRRALSIVFLLLILVPLSYLIQSLVVQRKRTGDGS